MAHGKRALPQGVKVTFEAITGRTRGRGIFGITEEGDEVARQAKLQRMAERMAAYDRGDEGNRRRCPQCGQRQKHKGDVSREVRVEGGTLTVVRAYYGCPSCQRTSYPLDAELGLGEEQEQGRLREKLALYGFHLITGQSRPSTGSGRTVKKRGNSSVRAELVEA